MPATLRCCAPTGFPALGDALGGDDLGGALAGALPAAALLAAGGVGEADDDGVFETFSLCMVGGPGLNVAGVWKFLETYL
jgi:hypothetical protein